MLRFEPPREKLRELCAAEADPEALVDALVVLVEALAKASLDYYEGVPALGTIELALDDARASADGSELDLIFLAPLPVTAALIRDLAPVIARHNVLLVGRAAGALTAQGVGPPGNGVRLRAFAPGRISIHLGGLVGVFDLHGAEVFGNLSSTLRAILDTHGSLEDPRKLDDWPDAIQALLGRVRALRRGGAILLVPSESVLDTVVAPNKFDLARPSARFTSAADASFNVSRATRSLAKHEFNAQEAGRNPSFERAVEYAQNKEHEEAHRAAGLNAVALLTAIDGAVVMNYSLGILAIGAKIIATCEPSSITRVDFVTRHEQRVPLHACGGTRHQSAIRFVASVDKSMALVCSQDGGISIAHRGEDGSVVVRRRVELALRSDER
jgi:hypothetical protein